MNPTLYESLERRDRPGWGRVWRLGVAAWKLIVGTVLVGSWWGAVLVAGWTARFMQRTAMKAWWQGQPRPFRKMLTFREVAARTDGLERWSAWPHWIVAQNVGSAVTKGRVWALFAGLWENAVAGLGLVAASTVVLAGPTALLALSWHLGWRLLPSDKNLAGGVQLAAVIGACGYAASLFYLPMAQARAAVAGNWRAFFDFRLIRRAIRRRWFACTILAVTWAVGASLAAQALAVRWARLPLENGSGWGTEAFLFPEFVALRWLAARIYASAVLQMLNDREIRLADLDPVERTAFPEAEVAIDATADTWTGRERFWAWTKSLPARAVLGAVVFAAGIAVVNAHAHLARKVGHWPWRDWHPITQAPFAPHR